MPRVLLVAQCHPPVGGSHATRVQALTRCLVEAPANVVGIAPAIGSRYPNRDDSAVEAAPIIRTSPGIAHAMAHGSTHVSGDDARHRPRPMTEEMPATRHASLGRVHTLRARVVAGALAAYRRIEVIDSYMDWIPPLATTLRRTIADGDVVVSTAMPNSTHVATLIALRGRANRWCADFGDPWTLNASQPRGRARAGIERFLEGAVMRRADLVTFTTARTMADYAARYPRQADRFAVARMGNEGRTEATVPYDSRRIFYGGALQADNRDATAVLKSIADFPEWEFVFAGAGCAQVEAHFGSALPTNVSLIPWLDHDDYVRMASESYACLVFGNRNGQQIPGKIYQLLPIARRVLYIAGMPAAEDEALTLDGFDPLVVQPTPADIAHALTMLDELPERDLARTGTYLWSATLAPVVDAVRAWLTPRG